MPAPTAVVKDEELPPLEKVESSGDEMDSVEEEELTAPPASMGEKEEGIGTELEEPLEDTQAGKATEGNDDKPQFAPAKKPNKINLAGQTRKVPIPPHRMSPLKQNWMKIYPPLVEHLKVQVRMNVKGKAVELRTSRYTDDTGALQKGADFVKAFALGFDVDDAIALLRLDDLYIETFEIKDVKTLQGEHLSRAIGRIAGKDGKTKFAIENASKTRVVLADSKIHILGAFTNIRIAREAIVSLILGSPPGKVYGNLRTVAARMKERF